MDTITTIGSETALLNAFRPRDRKRVELPKKLRFPVSFEHYMTWSESAGNYRYLVFRHSKTQALTGIAFKHSHPGGHVSSTRLCDWCHAYGPADQIDLLTVAPNSKRTVGLYLCVDLSCIQKIELSSKLSRKPFDSLAEELLGKIERFHENILAASPT